MKKETKLLLFALLTVVSSSTACYSQNVREALDLYFSEVRSGKYPAIPKLLLLPENSETTLETLTPYLNDTLPGVRFKAYGILSLAGKSARQPNLRQQAVQKLIGASHDKNSGNAGAALDYLTNFLKQDFNSSAKDSIGSLFKRKSYHFNKVIQLAGFLNLSDLKETIHELTLPVNSQQIRWAALLALTRMQDASARQELMARVEKLPVNDDVIYQLFPDLIYTRDREAFDYMITLLHSDGKYCTSADAERETPIVCGYRIMEMLAPVIKDYPLELDESGDIKTNDYLAALASVRYWFSQHKDYQIITNTY